MKKQYEAPVMELIQFEVLERLSTEETDSFFDEEGGNDLPWEDLD